MAARLAQAGGPQPPMYGPDDVPVEPGQGLGRQDAAELDWRARLRAALGRGDEAIRHYAGPHIFGALSKAADVAKVALPGSGTVQAGQEGRAAGQHAESGQYGKAAADLGMGMVSAAADWIPPAKIAMFAGMGARTFPWAKAAKADELEAAGKSADEIWKETGVFRGADNKWRFEIPDQNAKLNPNKYADDLPIKGEPAPVASDVWHPELYEAYPQIRKTQSSIEGSGENSGAYYQSGRDRKSGPLVEVAGKSPGDARSVALHELQHNVQDIEGFARGGNFQTPEVWSAASKRFDADKVAAEATLERIGDHRKAFFDDFRKTKDDSGAALVAYRAKFPKETEEFNKAFDVISTAGRPPGYRHQAYRDLAGEVESRNVQARRDMTDAERAAVPPWQSADTPTERQIVKGTREPGDVAEMAPAWSPFDPAWRDRAQRNRDDGVGSGSTVRVFKSEGALDRSRGGGPEHGSFDMLRAETKAKWANDKSLAKSEQNAARYKAENRGEEIGTDFMASRGDDVPRYSQKFDDISYPTAERHSEQGFSQGAGSTPNPGVPAKPRHYGQDGEPLNIGSSPWGGTFYRDGYAHHVPPSAPRHILLMMERGAPDAEINAALKAHREARDKRVTAHARQGWHPDPGNSKSWVAPGYPPRDPGPGNWYPMRKESAD